jgi:FG-GAP-like repeat/PASTA domain
VKRVFALIGLVVLSGSAGAAELTGGSAPSFRAARYFDTSAKAAESVAIGDLNGDGKPDVVAAHGADFPVELKPLRTVSVLLNRGDGRFQPSHAYPTGKSGDELGAWSVPIGDLTSDGNADLATANPGGKSVSVLVNSGRGQFQPPVNYSIDRQPWDVALVDLDGDGKLDIATANPTTITVLLNRGDGTFGGKVDFPTGRSTWAFAVRDLNGDGKPDIATANNNGLSSVSVLINRGDGTFETNVDFPTGAGPRGIAIGDLDGDDQPDVVTANGTSSPGGDEDWIDSVSVLRNKGDGTLRPRRNYRVRAGNRLDFASVRIGDVNGDRKPDIVTADESEHAISVFVNSGRGTFRRRFEYGPNPDDDGGLGAEAVALGDLNGDRKLDAVVPMWDEVSVLINAPGLCTVPEVEWIQLSKARRLLAGAHCRVGKIRRTKRVNRVGGVVFSQSPVAGTVLPKGGKVNLVVSRGPKAS